MWYGQSTASGRPLGEGTFWKWSGRASILEKIVKRSFFQFVLTCSSLMALGIVAEPGVLFASGSAQHPGSVTGMVRDAAGTPQIGAEVELLRADSTLVARVFTDRKGSYSIASVLPGEYALKALGASFIPTLKQNLRIRANTVVNLTLNTLYDLMQWTPVSARGRARSEDDWAWTLRSAESRPLLRWLDDGSPIVVVDGSAETRTAAERRRMRVAAEAGQRHFGSGADMLSLAMLQQRSPHRRDAVVAEFSPTSPGMMDAMLGFRQETGGQLANNSVQTLAAVMVDPQLTMGTGQPGLSLVSMRSWENLELLGGLEAEVGSQQVYARAGQGDSVAAAMPFANLTIHRGGGSIAYRVATARSEGAVAGLDRDSADASPENWLPVVSERAGQLVMEHGLHQELGWSATAGPAEMILVFYGDSVENPMIEASGRLSDGENAGGWMLVDTRNGLLRTAGPTYSSTGMVASVASRLPGGNHVRLSYASGDALVMHASPVAESLAEIVQGAHARHAAMYAVALSGTMDGVGTRWRASYRWQPDSTVTEVAPFALDASQPYLNVYIRQPLHSTRQGGGVEAQLDMRNLLSEGYTTFITSDGSRLYFAQAERSIAGGLAFTF